VELVKFNHQMDLKNCLQTGVCLP